MKHSQLPLLSGQKSRLNIVSVFCNHKELRFLLDTGANRSLIHVDALKEISINTTEDHVQISSLLMGEHEWNNICFHIDRGENKSETYHGIHTDGVLGTDVLNGTCWIFLRPERILHICDYQHPFFQSWTQKAPHHTPLRKHFLHNAVHPVWACTGTLNNHDSVHIDIDTGAQSTILTSAAGQFLNPHHKREPIRLSSGGGVQKAKSYRTKAEEIRISTISFPHPTVAVCDPIFQVAPELLGRPAILLGIDVFGEHSYALDFHDGGMWFSP